MFIRTLPETPNRCLYCLDADRQMALAARGQTMSVAFYPKLGLVLYGSEQAAVKAALGRQVPDGSSANLTPCVPMHIIGEYPMSKQSCIIYHSNRYPPPPPRRVFTAKLRTSRRRFVSTWMTWVGRFACWTGREWRATRGQSPPYSCVRRSSTSDTTRYGRSNGPEARKQSTVPNARRNKRVLYLALRENLILYDRDVT